MSLIHRVVFTLASRRIRPPVSHVVLSARALKSKAHTLVAGQVIEYENGLHRVESAEHVSMGRWKAYMKVEYVSLANGKKRQQRFRTDELVDVPDTDDLRLAFVGVSDDDAALLVFEDAASEQRVELAAADVSADLHVYLSAGDVCRVLRTEDKVLECILPVVARAVVAATTDPAKGSKTSTAHKPATLTNGRTIQVPQFVVAGDEIQVRLPEETYHGRA
jgi:elongation factor P